ncbi:hypothetical protein DY000_02026252 [Brassica cretica]|uniref:Uncharacterized protein n=1 Tax=Brassica cretica TaxID=69181 RepID=A0ABQ7EBW0_BRACR|nr:hypothetical protein DY000_02026252 [Brassica cretica]
MKNPLRELDLLLRWKVSFQISYDDSKKLHRCRSKALGRPEASSTLKPPSPELHNVESPSLSLYVLGESRNGDLRLRVFKIPQNPLRELDLLLRWKVSFQISYDDSKKLHRCRSKALGRPEASSTLKPPSPELHNVESPSLSLYVLGESRNEDLGLRVFKIPQVNLYPIPLSTRPALNPSREARNFAGLPNGGPIPPCKLLRAMPAVQILDCHPYMLSSTRNQVYTSGLDIWFATR